MHGETLFYKMGKHTVDHMQQGPIHVHSRIIKQDTTMGLKQNLGAGKKKKRKELKPGMLSY